MEAGLCALGIEARLKIISHKDSMRNWITFPQKSYVKQRGQDGTANNRNVNGYLQRVEQQSSYKVHDA